jgi:TetR/AcrR family transcriptional regulator, mexJK operon transcriptional repressor
MSKRPSAAKSKVTARAMNSSRIRRAILDGARRAFLRDGYTVSIEKIAVEAGTARKTIFNLFRSKDELFAAVLSEAVVHAVDARALDSDGDIEAVLRDFARHYLSVTLSEEMISLSRLVNAEYQRFPELIGRLSTDFFMQMIPRLSRYFVRLMESGRIIQIDPDMAAERFLCSIMGHERQRRALAAAPRSPALLRRYLDEAVRGFVHGVSAGP